MTKPRILICGTIVWATKELEEMFDGIAEVIHMESTDRDNFLQSFRPGAKYERVEGVFRDNTSVDQIGLFDKQIIDALATSVKWIAHNGAGYDQIDVLHCKAKGITVSNTPGAVDDATATTALYLLLATLRQFPLGERSLRAGTWKKPVLPERTHDITERTLAILGLGGIGLRFAHLAHAFPMKIIYHSRHKNEDAPDWCEYYEDRDKMIAAADILSVHVPLRKETENLVDKKMIRQLKKGSIIINTARGKVIDEIAMIEALEDGHLSSVGLDVFPDEPHVNPKLIEFPQNVLVPHMGTETRDTQKKMELRALQNLVDYIKSGSGKDIVLECR